MRRSSWRPSGARATTRASSLPDRQPQRHSATAHGCRMSSALPDASAAGRDRLRCGAASLEGRQPRLDLGHLADVLEALELGVQARRGELLLTADPGLLAPDLVLEATDLARRVHDVDRLDRILHRRLGLHRLLPGDQLVTLRRQLAELLAHLLEPGLELVDDLGLRRDAGLGALRLALGLHLT